MEGVVLEVNGAFGAGVTAQSLERLINFSRAESNITDRWRLGVLLPDAGLREPDVSSSSADDQEDRS